MEATNRTKRFADYINKMDFFEVAEFFNFMMEDMMQIENHRMLDWEKQEDAELILKEVGIFNFTSIIDCKTPEENAVLWSIDQNGEHHCEWHINPWTEILDGYSDWILDHLEGCMNGKCDRSAIDEKYPDIFDILKESKNKFIVRIVETAAYEVKIEAESKEAAEKFAMEERPDYPVWENGEVHTNYTARLER